MITLTNSVALPPNVAFLELILQTDAIASFLGGSPPVTMQEQVFGPSNWIKFPVSAGFLAAGSQVWSNAELTPVVALSNYYLVAFYDQNMTRLTASPFQWTFTQLAGSTVDIGTMLG